MLAFFSSCLRVIDVGDKVGVEQLLGPLFVGVMELDVTCGGG